MKSTKGLVDPAQREYRRTVRPISRPTRKTYGKLEQGEVYAKPNGRPTIAHSASEITVIPIYPDSDTCANLCGCLPRVHSSCRESATCLTQPYPNHRGNGPRTLSNCFIRLNKISTPALTCDHLMLQVLRQVTPIFRSKTRCLLKTLQNTPLSLPLIKSQVRKTNPSPESTRSWRSSPRTARAWSRS